MTQVYEGEKHFDLVVRWLREYRKSLEAIREITVPTPDGTIIPLAQIASIEMVEGPSHHLSRGRAALHAGEVLGARARPGGAPSRRRRQKIAEQGAAPLRHAPGLGGRDQRAARGRWRGCCVIIPLTLLLIGFLVYSGREELARHADRPRRHSGRVHRRRPGALDHAARISRCRRPWGSCRSSASRCRTRC